MMQVKLICEQCHLPFVRENPDYRSNFYFCSRSCGAVFNNLKRDYGKQAKTISKIAKDGKWHLRLSKSIKARTLPLISCNCICCHSSFLKKKNSKKTICGTKCSSKHALSKRGVDMESYYNRKSDPFKYYLAIVKNRVRKDQWKRSKPLLCTVDLTVPFLKTLWESQKGRCPYTGWEMLLPAHGHGWNKSSKNIKRASLDRKNNSLGYVCGNVQFVSVMANLAKSEYQDEDLFEFCEAVTKKQRGGSPAADLRQLDLD